MSRTRVRAEDLFCARCGRALRPGANHWPEGYICQSCMTRALETYGTCVGCGVERLTPGLTPDSGLLCTDCAGGIGDFFCEQCGQEARRYRRGVCGQCVLAERLRDLLDDGTGSVRAELLPLFDALRQMRRPRGGLYWTSHPHVQRNLRALARGEVPLTHEGLSQLTPWRSVAYLRDLLVQSGVLPPADRQLLFFQRWLAEKLPAVGDAEHRKLLELFAAWHVQRRLRTLASRGPLTGNQIQQAREEIRLATAFLGHLTQRGHALADCTQADVDAWYAGGYTARRLTHAFLRWAMRSKHMPKVAVPHRSTSNPAPIAQHQRLALLRQAMNRDDVPLQDRIAAALVLLYAQPLTRIVRLTTDDIHQKDSAVLVRLGDPPSPVPAPFAGMLLDYLGQRPNTMTATNPDARWLFPGRRAGQPMTPETLELRLRHLGFPTQRGRTAAIRQLVLQAPAPVVARMLGYDDDTTARLAEEAGGTWRHYAPGDHSR
jgi:site-specific recombinase XerD